MHALLGSSNSKLLHEDNTFPVTSVKTGRGRIKQAAKIHNDVVTERLNTLMGDDAEDNDVCLS